MSRRLSLTVTRQILRLQEAPVGTPRAPIPGRAMHNKSSPSASPSQTTPQQSQPQQQQRSASTAASNPFILKHGDFGLKQAARPDFNHSLPIEVGKTPDPAWKYGKGVNDRSGQHLQHVEIDPYRPDRNMISNYRLLIAAIPRPISFVSTVSKDGMTANLAPFSYFQVVDHDPPILVIGFSARATRPKDTRKNLVETGECVISVVSEHMIEAVNGTSLDVPYGVSEWGLSGFQSAPSATVKPSRVKDAIFSMEGKLLEMKDLDYGHENDGKPHGALAVIQVTRFWVREDALNATHDDINLSKMRPLVQLGGISYSRVRETFELPRPSLEAELKDDSKGLRPYLEAEVEPQGSDPSGLPHEESEELARAVA